MARTYPNIEHLHSLAKPFGFIVKTFWAAGVVALSLLEDNTLIFGVIVGPSLLNLLLMEPTNHDLASRVVELGITSDRAWSGRPWCDVAWRVVSGRWCGRPIGFCCLNILSVSVVRFMLQLLRREI